MFLAITDQTNELHVGSSTTRDHISLGAFESQAMYAASHLFFVRGGNLMAQAFDVETRQLKGSPLHLGAQVGVNPSWDRGTFSVATSGRLVYRPTARALSQLTWLDRRGDPVGTVGEPAVINNFELSPDDQRVAIAELTHQHGSRSQFDIWVRHLTTGRTTRLTDDPGWDFDPTWSPDGTQVAFISSRPPTTARFGLWMRASNGTGSDVSLAPPPANRPSWGRHNVIVYNVNGGADTSTDLWTMSMVGDRTPTVFLKTKHSEGLATFSPDSRWVAYQSNVSGRDEVYVRPYLAKEPSYRVSRDGGARPRWRGDGKELFMLSAEGLMMAAPNRSGKRVFGGCPATALRGVDPEREGLRRQGRWSTIPDSY